MIVPSIDLMGGRAVQLVGGRGEPVESTDPFETAERFAVVGEIAVIDLDAAMSRGSNARTVRELLTIARCRVGGGIRDADAVAEAQGDGQGNRHAGSQERRDHHRAQHLPAV